jgi:pimeloyl-ACP methyl ester carboxylesterase
MKRAGIRIVFTFILITAALMSAPSYTNAFTGKQYADSAMASLKGASTAFSTTRIVPSLYYTWYEANLKYNAEYPMKYPLSVDFVGSNFSAPKGVVYMLPGGGMNFRASFLTPIDDNLAQYFRKSGYLVVGITPREDNVSSSDTDLSFMEDWGMDEHVKDIAFIIRTIQDRSLCKNLPYKVLGHSFGAAFALDFASKCKALNPATAAPVRVMALDIYSFDPLKAEDAEYIYYSGLSAEGFQDAIDGFDSGGNPITPVYADSSYTSMKSLMLISALLPLIPSSESYDELGRVFTYEGFLYYSMIYSKALLSVQQGDWPLNQGYVAGGYTIPDPNNPYRDTYFLSYSSMSTLRDASLKVGSGLVPLAVYRDFFQVNTYSQLDGYYAIDWTNITSSVLWLNTYYGYNAFMGGASFIPKQGKDSVLTFTASGYGHLDILSNNARNTKGVNGKKPIWYWLTYPDYPRCN